MVSDPVPLVKREGTNMARTDDNPAMSDEELVQYAQHLAEVTDGRGDETLQDDEKKADA